MSSKQLLTALAVILTYCNYSSAQSQTDVTIKEATVFLHGAEVSCTASVNLPKGESRVIFTNIADRLNERSMSVGISNNVVIKSATFQSNYLTGEQSSPRLETIQDSIDLLENRIADIEVQLAVVKEQIKLLSRSGDSGTASTQLQPDQTVKMLELVKARLGNHLSEQNKLNKTLKEVKKNKSKLRNQYYAEKGKLQKREGQILVTFFAEKATRANVKITYVIDNAGWRPSYDIRVASLNDPVEVLYKAHVYQVSGVDWNDVKLTLSTGNPSQSAQAPEFEPWHLEIAKDDPHARTYVGYNYNYDYSPDTVYVEDPIAGEVTLKVTQRQYDPGIDNTGVNTTFHIQLPYSIPSNYDRQNVAIKTVKAPATYRYYAAPKIESDVFLQALVPNWEDLNLLPAKTNIFFENTFVGNGFIDAKNLKDTMDISLGRDKKIIVQRTADKKYRSKRTIGSNIREQFLYNNTVRNLRNDAINLTLVDQIPISDDKEIDINDLIYDGATFDETTGKTTWQMELKPGETKEVKTGYTVKYPKGTSIVNL